MKKYILSILSLVAAMAFTSCEDVPAPYELNPEANTQDNENKIEDLVIYKQDFATSLGDFETFDFVGNYPWIQERDYAKATSYENSVDYKSDSWLISPYIDLSNVDSACIYFKYILRYANSAEMTTNYQLLVSDDYDGNPTEATWTTLDYNPVQSADYNTWHEGNYLDIPQNLKSEKTTIAFRYIAQAKAATWEICNFVVYRGSHNSFMSSQTINPADIQKLPYTETFETSLGTFKSELISGSGSWIIDYKTAKATGYSNHYTAGKYMLVSAPVNISEAAHISYEYILRYKQKDGYTKLVISDNYKGNASTATWTTLKNNHTEGKDWTNFEKADVSIPSAYIGKTVYVALYFECTSSGSATWEVRNLTIAAGNGGSSEENVIPEENNDEENNDIEHTLPYEESFSSSLGSFKSELISGEGTWVNDYNTARATNYDNATKTNTAGQYMLISAPVKISEAAHISYEYILRYIEDNSYYTLLISDDYAGNASTATWTTLKNDHTEGSDWTNFVTANVNVPSKFVGKTVRIAFSFTAKTKSATWEVKNLSIAAGSDGETVEEPDAYNINFATNGFSGWVEQTTQNIQNKVWNYESGKGIKADVGDGVTEIESRLVSPLIALPSTDNVTLSFNHSQQFFESEEAMTKNLTLQISTDKKTWTTIQFNGYPEVSNNYNITSANATADLSAYKGKPIYIAFRFTDTKGTWIIQSVSIK